MKEKIEQYVNAIREAEKAAIAASLPEDDGTCNLDYVIIDFKGWRQSTIDAIAIKSGIAISHALSGLHKGFRFISFTMDGQGNNRTRMAEAAKKKLCELGIPASVYYQMD